MTNLYLTDRAERDLAAAADYIEYELFNPEAADALYDAVDEMANRLKAFLRAYPLIDDPVFKSWGIRLAPIQNYLMFYTIQGDAVYIVRFLYQRRDWQALLKQNQQNQK